MGTQIVKATYDGSTFQITEPINLEPNTDCILTIEIIEEEPYEDPFKYILKHAGTVPGPADWSVEHDHYLYGTPKNKVIDE